MSVLSISKKAEERPGDSPAFQKVEIDRANGISTDIPAVLGNVQ